MMDAGTLVVAAILLVACTWYFPVEGRKALLLEAVKGGIYLVAAVLLIFALVEKVPEIGWGFSAGVLTVLTVAFVLLSIRSFYKSARDLKGGKIEKVILSKCTLKKGTTSSFHQIKGKDETGRTFLFQISKKTFWDLMDAYGRVEVRYYPCTKIVVKIKCNR